MNRIQIMANVTSSQTANHLMVNTNKVPDDNSIKERIKKMNHEKFLIAKEMANKTGLAKTALHAKLKEIEREQSELDPNWLTGRHIREVVGTVNKVVAPKDRTLHIIENALLNPEHELPDWDEALLSPAPTSNNEPDEETTENADVISPPTAPVEVIATPTVKSEGSLSDENSAPENIIIEDDVLTILPELENFLPPLTPKQFSALEKRLCDEGCRNAIVVWNHIIVDGHNRYKICKAHNIKFKIIEKEFPNIEAVKVWMIDNQKEQRQLSPFQTIVLSIMRAKILEPTAKANQLAGLKQNSTAFQNSEKRIEPIDLTKIAAELADVSPDTASRVKKILKYGSVEDRELLYNGQKSINKVYTDIRDEEKLRKKIATTTVENNGAWSQHNIELDEKNHVMYISPRYFKPDPEAEEVTIFNDLRYFDINSMVEDKATLFIRIRPQADQKAKKLIKDWGFKYVESFFVTQSEYSFSTEYTEQIHDIIIICIRNGGIPVSTTAKKIKSVIDDGQVYDAIINMYDKSCRIMKFCPSDPNEENKWKEQNIKDRIEGDEPASI